MKKNKNYTPQYAMMQAAYWMVNSVLVSYAAVFFGDKGFSSGAIGKILAVASLCAVVFQPLIASYIDKSEKVTSRIGAMCITILAIIMSLGMIFLQKNMTLVPVLFVLVYMFFAAIQPLLSSIGMECVDYGNKMNFGFARGLGSWGYAILSVLAGYYLLVFSSSTLPIIYMVMFIVLFVLLLTFIYKDVRTDKVIVQDETDEEAHTNFIEFAKCYPGFIVFLVGTVLVFYGHMLVNNFAINLFENVGGNSSDMGIGVGFSAFLELPAMVFVTKFKDKIDVKKMLIVSSISFTLRHLLFWISTSVTMLIVAEGLQMFAYAVFAAASVYYINDMMGKKDAVKGQSYSIIAITIGGIFASLIGGAMIDKYGLRVAEALGVILTAIGSIIMIIPLLSKKKVAGE